MSEGTKLNILKEILGKHYKTGNEYLFYCPKCNHHKKKLSINLKKNAFHCWICDYRGNSVYRIVRKFGNFNLRQQWEEIDGKVDLSESLYEKIFGKKEEEPEPTLKLPEEFISLANKGLPITASEPLKYLRERGVGKKDIIKWKIGYCSKGDYENRILIPSFNNDGKVSYFVGRTYDGEWDKYKNPEGISKDLIFNSLYVDWKNDLCIVEGVFDAIVAGNAVPLLGSTLRENSKLFQEIVKHDTPVYLALDPDARKKAVEIVEAMLKYGIEIHMIDVGEDKDIGEMTKEEFRERKANAVEMNPKSLLEFRAERRI